VIPDHYVWADFVRWRLIASAAMDRAVIAATQPLAKPSRLMEAFMAKYVVRMHRGAKDAEWP
jgi:hypothetical protein